MNHLDPIQRPKGQGNKGKFCFYDKFFSLLICPCAMETLVWVLLALFNDNH